MPRREFWIIGLNVPQILERLDGFGDAIEIIISPRDCP